MVKVIVNGSTVEVSTLTDAQVEYAVQTAIEYDNHAAQNVDATDPREWLTQYCDLHLHFYGRLATI